MKRNKRPFSTEITVILVSASRYYVYVRDIYDVMYAAFCPCTAQNKQKNYVESSFKMFPVVPFFKETVHVRIMKVLFYKKNLKAA